MSEKEFYTVKEIAEELGLSKQTIQYHIKFLPTKNRQRNNKKIILLDSEDILLIKEKLTKRATKRINKHSTKEKQKDDFFIEQLREKDKQIEKLQKLLENQQILTLKANEKIDLLESENNKQKNKWWKFWK